MDPATLKKAIYAAVAAILSVTVGAVLENTWATPDQYLRLSPVRIPKPLNGRNVHTAVVFDTVIWRAENWGGKSLDGLMIRVGNPACGAKIVDGFIIPSGTAIVTVAMSRLYPQGTPNQNIVEYTISSWPREGVLTLGTVFQGTREQRCFTARIVSSANTDRLIVTDAPKLWLTIRTIPLLAAGIAAAALLLLLGPVFLILSRRRT